MKSKKQQLFRKRTQIITALLVIVAVAIAGVHLLVSSHAQSPYVATSAARGTLGGGANLESSNYVQFGFTTAQLCSQRTTALTVHVCNGNLVNGSGQTIRLLGADEFSTEEYCVTQDKVAEGLLNQAEADGMASWHMNAIRIPMDEDCWLGESGDNVLINGVTGAAAAQIYQTAIKNFVTYLNNDGIYAILDLAAGGAGMPEETTTFWSSIATTFKSNPAVIYDLYNEPDIDTTTPGASYNPSSADWKCWLEGSDYIYTNKADTCDGPGMQQLVTTIRSAGATQPILIAGLNKASDPCGMEDSDYSGTCMIVADKPTDPLSQLTVDFHNYYSEQGYSQDKCYQETCWNAVLSQLKTAGLPLVTAEFGEFDCSDIFVNTYMGWADQNNVSYLAWAWVPPNDPSQACVTYGQSTTMSQNNFPLISSYNKPSNNTPVVPNPEAPEASNYQAHLAMPSVYNTEY